MKRIGTAGFVRSLMLAAAAVFTLSFAPAERAQAMSLITPGASPAKAANEGLIEVRGGGGRGGGGFHGGGGFRGGGGFHGGGFRGGGFHAFHGGGWHGRGWHGGGFHRFSGFHRFGGHRFAYFPHRRFFFHRRFYGGYYPYYSYPHYCRVIWTYYGPRRICGYRRGWYYRRYYW